MAAGFSTGGGPTGQDIGQLDASCGNGDGLTCGQFGDTSLLMINTRLHLRSHRVCLIAGR
ncbi:hypothetical protein AZF01_07390 [Martelella sp. AD-3]|nr:hypothetical protein AZF01_07390 [Martelella sp. AD-3]MAM12013.1 hypothetical protein [Rhizobiaceae bacterium]